MPFRDGTQDGQVISESSDKTWSTGWGNGKSSHYTCQEYLMNCIKGQKKKNDTKRWIPPGLKVSNMVLGKSREELSIAPEWMKQLGQSGYNTQLLMCLVMEVKPDAAKNSTVWEPGMLCPWIKENWICQAGDAKNKHRHPRNQWTKMNGNGQI